MRVVAFVVLFLAFISQANAGYLHGEFEVKDCTITETTLECSKIVQKGVQDLSIILMRSGIKFAKIETKLKVNTRVEIGFWSGMQLGMAPLYVKGRPDEVNAFVQKLFKPAASSELINP